MDIVVKPGSHQSENAGMIPAKKNPICRSYLSPNLWTVNKQLNDKERVAAALENPVLLDTVEQCLSDVTKGITLSI